MIERERETERQTQYDRKSERETERQTQYDRKSEN